MFHNAFFTTRATVIVYSLYLIRHNELMILFTFPNKINVILVVYSISGPPDTELSLTQHMQEFV